MSQFVSTYSLALLTTTGKQEKLACREDLQSQNFVKEITDSTAKVQYGVSTRSREIIATLEQLQKAQFEMMEAVTDSVREVGGIMKPGL